MFILLDFFKFHCWTSIILLSNFSIFYNTNISEYSKSHSMSTRRTSSLDDHVGEQQQGLEAQVTQHIGTSVWRLAGWGWNGRREGLEQLQSWGPTTCAIVFLRESFGVVKIQLRCIREDVSATTFTTIDWYKFTGSTSFNNRPRSRPQKFYHASNVIMRHWSVSLALFAWLHTLHSHSNFSPSLAEPDHPLFCCLWVDRYRRDL